jgi:hypothetical protein
MSSLVNVYFQASNRTLLIGSFIFIVFFIITSRDVLIPILGFIKCKSGRVVRTVLVFFGANIWLPVIIG